MTATPIAGRNVLVMGLGSFGGGLGATRFLAREGARVTVTDLRDATELEEALPGLAGLDVELVLGGHRAGDFERADLVVANPAVAPDNEFLQTARRAGASILSEVELFLERCPARLAAITGTQGKSSTSSMLAQLLEHCGFEVHLGGNIGGSLLESLGSMRASDVCVLELSSYQLEALRAPEAGDPPLLAGRAELVAITNVLADHLERHGTRQAYELAKLRILELVDETGWAILPEQAVPRAEMPSLRGRAIRRGPGAELELLDGEFRLAGERLGRADSLPVPGAFQRENALVALGAARLLGARAEALERALPLLVGLDHRLQDLGLVRGRRVWDNGVSTTPDSTASALASMPGSCVLLAGGRYKATLPLDVLIEAARGRVRLAVTFGADADVLAAGLEAAGVPCRRTADLERAVQTAFAEAGPDEAVLFSPACASFDAYRNFRERALEFRRLLETLAERG